MQGINIGTGKEGITIINFSSDIAICRVFTPSDRPGPEVDTSLRPSPKIGFRDLQSKTGATSEAGRSALGRKNPVRHRKSYGTKRTADIW